jgi:hypothetical protein
MRRTSVSPSEREKKSRATSVRRDAKYSALWAQADSSEIRFGFNKNPRGRGLFLRKKRAVKTT